MKLCILDPADFLGGAELFTVDICPYLLQKNTVTILHSGKCQTYDERLRKFLSHSSQKKRQQKIPLNDSGQAGMTHKKALQSGKAGIIPQLVLRPFAFPRLRPFRPFAFIKTLFRLSSFLRKNTFDVVQTNSVRVAILMGALRFFGFHRSVRWIHIQHDFTFPRRLAFLFTTADKILTCSEIVSEDLQKKGVSSEKMESVGNGIKIPKLPPNPPQRGGHERKRIAIIGRIDPWKGQQQFLFLAQKFPQYDFLVAGKSSDHDSQTQGFEKKLHQQKEEKNISNLTFLGFQDISKLFPTLDLVLHLSLEKEPFGRVVLESLAYGIPVLASDRGGAREILTGDFLSSLLVDPENLEEIRQKIKRIFREESFQNSYKYHSQKRAEYFSLTLLVKKIEESLIER